MRLGFVGTVICLMLIGCKNSLLIESNESLLQNSYKESKLVCIAPRFYFAKEEDNFKLEEVEKITFKMKKDIVSFSKKNGVDLTLYDIENVSPAGYQDLFLLKKSLLDANFNQSPPLNYSRKTRRKNPTQRKVFVYPPKISYEFNTLSSKYETPLFSYLGIYYVNEKLILYHVVIDTDLCETIYREYKTINSKINQDKIGQMIYDSYATLRKELIRK